MSELLNLYLFAEMLAGLLIFGSSTSVTKTDSPRGFNINVDWFKLLLGILLVLLASFGKSI